MSLLGNIWVKLGLKSDDFQRGMDSAEKKSSKFGNLMKGVAAKVLTVAAAMKVLGSTFKTLANFEASTSKLASVLGKTTTEIKGLTQSAIDLGRRTQYTASEVVSLQTELAKLGFVESDIKGMQESVLKFAAAVGTDLASAAARAGATMRGFGLTAEQTGDLLEVMAVSTSKSALSFNYLDATLGKLVPVTKAYGFDAKDTITLLGTMANAGIDASSAGTALRRVFVELSNGSSKLNTALGKQPKTMDELIEALGTLKERNLSVADSANLVGKYAAPAFAALVSGADDCRALYAELQNVNGALDTMYDTMTNNVKGAIDRLKSSWEGFIFNLQGSTGVISRMIKGLTRFVDIANHALFAGTRVGEYKQSYDTRRDFTRDDGTGLSQFEVQAMYARNRQRLEGIKAASKEGSRAWRQADEELQGLIASENEYYDNLIKIEGKTQDVFVDGTEEGNDALAELLKGLKTKENYEKDSIGWLKQEIQARQELRDAATDETEIRKLNTEIALLEKKVQELQKIGEITELNALKAPVGKAEGGSNPLGIDTSALKHTSEEVDEFVKRLKKQQSDAEDISRGFADALRNGMIDALDELAEAIGTGDLDTTALVRALVTPLADMAISAGVLIMTTGESIEALKNALTNIFSGPYGAIAAGAALVAIGVAAKAGLAAIASGSTTSGGHASGGGNPYTYTGGYGVTPDMLSSAGPMEIEGTVTVKGQDIQIALDNYNANKRR